MTFNTIDFQILGLPSYLFVALSGGVITICLYIVLMFSKEYDISQSMKILFFSLIGMAVGAKLFGFITGVYRDIGLGKKITKDSIFDTGIVFYGGLFGLIGCYTLLLDKKQCILDKYAIDVLAVCIPFFIQLQGLDVSCQGAVMEKNIMG